VANHPTCGLPVPGLRRRVALRRTGGLLPRLKRRRRPADICHMRVPHAAEPELQAPLDLGSSLTRRERQVLQLIADGLANRSVAEALVVSEDTVKTHVHRILKKLGATSRANAVAIGIRANVIR
jgi:DNA-binding NarL/FixJ family response regulator